MPYASKAQQRYFHAAEERGEMPKKTVDEFDKATKAEKGGFKRLPEHVSDKPAKKEAELQKHLAERQKRRAPQDEPNPDDE